MVTNMKNTIHGFKRLLGRKHNDPYVKQEKQYLPYDLVSNPDGSMGIRVSFLIMTYISKSTITVDSR